MTARDGRSVISLLFVNLMVIVSISDSLSCFGIMLCHCNICHACILRLIIIFLIITASLED